MNRQFSLYLDALRLVAALLVVLYHANLRLLSSGKLPLSEHGHAAVIVFFVLSGYVIAHVSSTRETTPRAYWASRLARFYSLVLPAVLLCPFIDVLGEALAPQFYLDRTTHTLAWLRVLTSLAFLNEVWGWSIMSFSNVPYWSLCYEMAYYVLYAVCAFTAGRARRWLLAGCLLLIGPKILLLAPVWALGVLLQRWLALRRLPQWLGWLLFLGSWPLYGLFHHYQLSEAGSQLLRHLVGAELHRSLSFSRYFLTDYLLALIVAANFAGYRSVARHSWRPLAWCAPAVRWLATYTFALYLLHQPLLQLFAAAIDGDPHRPWFFWQVITATLLTVWLAGSWAERRRPAMRAWLFGQLGRLAQSRWWRRAVAARLARQSA